MAAVLACGPHALLSHRAAAALWGLWAPPARIDVTSTDHRAVPGVGCHWARRLHPDDQTEIDGIPVTSLPRVFLDLAEHLIATRLQSLIEQADRQGLVDGIALQELLGRANGRRGRKKLADVLASLADEAPWTQSGLERAFLEFIRASGLPEPLTNVLVDGVLVDFFWPDFNLIVELDPYDTHKSRRAFEEDRRRDAIHTLAGRRQLRITGSRFAREKPQIRRELSMLMSQTEPRPLRQQQT